MNEKLYNFKCFLFSKTFFLHHQKASRNVPCPHRSCAATANETKTRLNTLKQKCIIYIQITRATSIDYSYLMWKRYFSITENILDTISAVVETAIFSDITKANWFPWGPSNSHTAYRRSSLAVMTLKFTLSQYSMVLEKRLELNLTNI